MLREVYDAENFERSWMRQMLRGAHELNEVIDGARS
jgi:hypothetical protein